MDIWILVLVLLVIAIILLLLSVLVKDTSHPSHIKQQIDEQAEKIRNLQQQLHFLDKEGHEEEQKIESIQAVTAEEVYYPERDNEPISEPIMQTEELVDSADAKVEANYPRINYEISDRHREDIVRLYSQGYTLKEIQDEVEEEAVTIQYVIDEYIENR